MDSSIGRKDLDLQDNDDLKKRLLGATTEIGTGIGTDLLTGSLLNPATIAGTKGLSILAYAGINGFQGAYTNYLVQKHLYGADNVNWGEILSSGALSAIPFMDLKAGKNVANIVGDANTLRRGIVGGAGFGLAGEQLRVGIDEQRVLSPLEAGMAVGLGGGIGGGLTQLSKLGKKPNVVPKFDPTGATDDLMRQQAGLKMRLLNSIDPEGDSISKKGFDPNITKKNLKLFNEIGFTGTNKLDIQDMLYGIDADGNPLMSQYKRRVLKAGIGDETFNWSAFTKNRDAVAKDFLDGLQDLNIDPKTIHGHHISALRITSSLFDGLSPIQRKKLIKIFQREGLKLGNHPDNLLALHKSTHLDVVHPFLEKQVGKYGQLLLDPAKMKKLNPRQREELVKKFAKIIKRSEEIAMESTQKWLDETFESLNPQAAFDAKMDILNRAFNDDVAFRAKLLKSVKSNEPLLPYQAEDVEIPVTPKTKKARVTSKQTKFKNLLKKIKAQNPNTKQMTIWDISDDALDAYRKLF